MKTKEMLAMAALVALIGSGGPPTRAGAQSPEELPALSERRSIEEMRALLQKKGGSLDRAQEEGAVERARLAAERSAERGEVKRLLDEAVERGRPVADAAELEAQKRAEEQLERAKANLSDEAKLRMERMVQNPARALPVTPPSDPVKPADFGSAQPKQPERVDIAPKESTNRVKVTAAGAAEFDSRTGIAIFTEDVVVEHPSFYLECDELEVHMNQEATKAAEAEADGAAPSPAPAPGAAPAAAEPGQQQSGIELAIAKGRMVVLKKNSEDGKLQVGHCRHAVFDGVTGDIEMRIWPQIQKGNEILKATSESTVIIIKQDGRMSTKGGGVVLVADSKEKK